MSNLIEVMKLRQFSNNLVNVNLKKKKNKVIEFKKIKDAKKSILFIYFFKNSLY